MPVLQAVEYESLPGIEYLDIVPSTQLQRECTVQVWQHSQQAERLDTCRMERQGDGKGTRRGSSVSKF